MTKATDKFAHYVEHPKFGRGPNYTDLVPIILDHEKFVLFSRASTASKIKGTAIAADMGKQSKGSAYLIKYYFDEDKLCCDCNQPFLFFAREQKHWFDELGLNINIQGKRCYNCRKEYAVHAQNNKRFGQLKHLNVRSVDETIEMAEICLHELEMGRFHPRQIETVRMLRNILVKESLDSYPNIAQTIAGIESRIKYLDR